MRRSTRAPRPRTALAAAVLLLGPTACSDGDGGAESDLAGADAADAQGDGSVDGGGDTGPAEGETVTPDGDGGETADGGGDCGGGEACDDGLPCTTDACEDGSCVHTVEPGHCVGGSDEDPVCLDDLEPNPANTCLLCEPNGQQEPGWIEKTDGAACDDGNACTVEDRCQLGECEGAETRTCETDNPCAEASCDPEEGCVEEPVEGDCDDGSPCTTDDTCVDGTCTGEPVEGDCDDGNPCTLGDTCVDGSCQPGDETPDCDDGDPCTADSCVPEEGGCVHDEDKCDDGDPCTEDICQPDGSCEHEPFEGPCDDGDACTVGETCDAEGTCGGGEPKDCDDGNPCTEDSCDPDEGCQHVFAEQGTSCDDGFACTEGDECSAGQCVGSKSGCPPCQEPVADHAIKLIEMQISADGEEGSGFDVDDDPSTCAPEGSCSGGVDNSMADLAGVLNPALSDSIEEGNLMYVSDLSEVRYDGEPFDFPIFQSVLTDASAEDDCDFQEEECGYDPLQTSYDAGCEPFFAFDNARIEGFDLIAGGEDFLVTVGIALTPTEVLPLTIARARLEATLTFEGTGDDKKIVGANGFVGGAIPKAQLIETVQSVDPDLIGDIDKSTLIDVIQEVVTNDIDLDGDGELDAASVALRVEAIPADLGSP